MWVLGLLLGVLGEEPRWVKAVSPLVQVFPEGRLVDGRGPVEARLEAARGEWEPFQLVVRGPLAEVRAEAGELVGADGAQLPAPRLYRVGYVRVTTPSSVEGHAGRWPDPLIPDVDAFAGEKRRAFPFEVPAGEERAIWVALFVPRSARPGEYRGAVSVRARGRAPVAVPVAITVHRFALPATSSLPVTFGFAAAATRKLHGTDDPALARRYALSALRHRISLHGGEMEPPNEYPPGVLDTRAYDAEVGPFLDGTADPGGPAEGARYSAIDLRVPGKLTGQDRERYVAAMVAHLEARGWLDRVFDYAFDEPARAQLPLVRARAESTRRAAPRVPRLVTRVRTPSLAGAVDLWCPTVNLLDDKPGAPSTFDGEPLPPRKAYDRPGERLWWYQACMSHGCDIVGGDYFTGWPSLVVDAPAVSHRILEWLTYHHRIGGELYYNTVEAYVAGRDPWEDQRLHGGNGDGTLFYPGTPARIGGRTHVPVESIRLELVREGLEDYEYLRLHEARFGRARTDALAASIAPHAWQWQHDGARLFAARHQLASELDEPLAVSH